MVKATITVSFKDVRFEGPNFRVGEVTLEIEGVEKRLLCEFCPPYVWETVEPKWESEVRVIYRREDILKTEIDTEYLLESTKRRVIETVKKNLAKRALEGNHTLSVEVVIE